MVAMNLFFLLAGFSISGTVKNKVPLEDYIGIEYELVKNENLDALLRALKVPEREIMFAGLVSQVMTLKKEGDQYMMDIVSTVALIEAEHEAVPFTLGKPFDLKTRDGRDTICTSTVDGNKLVQVLEDKKEGGQKMVITKEFTKDTLVGSTEYGDITCVRWFKKKEKQDSWWW